MLLIYTYIKINKDILLSSIVMRRQLVTTTHKAIVRRCAMHHTSALSALSYPSTVRIIEVGPRDGLQNEKRVIPIDIKVALIKK